MAFNDSPVPAPTTPPDSTTPPAPQEVPAPIPAQPLTPAPEGGAAPVAAPSEPPAFVPPQPITPAAPVPAAPQQPAPAPFQASIETAAPAAAQAIIEPAGGFATAPTPGVAPVAPIGGGLPGTVPVSGPAKFPTKLIAIIAAVVGGLVFIGLSIWLVVSLLGSASLSLKTYQGDGFSILVPDSADYVESKTTASVEFKKKNTDSGVRIQKQSYYGAKKASMIEQFDKTFTVEELASSATAEFSLDKPKLSNTKVGGLDARTLTGDTKVDGAKTGTATMAYIFGDDALYIVIVAAHTAEPGLLANATKILNSFTLK